MSTTPTLIRRKSITDLLSLKHTAKIVALTAYNSLFARLFDNHVDILLVGDSLGMVQYGMESTIPVTLDLMIAHGKAVVNGSSLALVVVDMPFGSYQASPETAFHAAARILKETGCQAVKLEGGKEMQETIAFLTSRGIPVMGHIGLMPQHVNTLGGYRYRGKTQSERDNIIEDALAVQLAGAFAMVMEGMEEKLAGELTQKLDIITIGIGASVACDGQILVAEDMLGMTPIAPRFVKKYAHLAPAIEQAVGEYAREVRTETFPTPLHCFSTAKPAHD